MPDFYMHNSEFITLDAIYDQMEKEIRLEFNSTMPDGIRRFIRVPVSDLNTLAFSGECSNISLIINFSADNETVLLYQFMQQP